MSASNESFEARLRAFQPIQPTPQLVHAIAAQLDPPAAPPREATLLSPWARFSLGASWAITAVAASAAVMLYLDRPGGATPGEATGGEALPLAEVAATAPPARGDLRVTPVDARGYLYDAVDEGIVYLENGMPARRVRYQFLDTVEMRAEGKDASVALTYPREEIRFIPVNYY